MLNATEVIVDVSFSDGCSDINYTLSVIVINEPPYLYYLLHANASTPELLPNISTKVGTTLISNIPNAHDPENIATDRSILGSCPSFLTFNSDYSSLSLIPDYSVPASLINLTLCLSDKAQVVNYTFQIQIINDPPYFVSNLTN